MKRILLVAAITVLFSPAVAQAASTIVAGMYSLMPETADQVIQIMATGDDRVAGVNFIFQIADGSGIGPLITNIDLTGPGTIFGANNTGMVDVLNGGQIPPKTFTPGHQAWVGTTTTSGTVLANGVLAFVTLDTRGTGAGCWDLLLSIPEYEVQTDWADPNGVIVPVLINGLTCYPEPSSLGLASIAGCGLLVYAARRHRARLAKVVA